MTIEEQVQAVLIADSGVTAIVPASRIKTPNDLQSIPLPYIEHFGISPTPEYLSGGRMALTEWSYQVSCFASTHSAARMLSIAVRNALEETHSGTTFFWSGSKLAPYEPDVKVSHIAVEFQAWEAL